MSDQEWEKVKNEVQDRMVNQVRHVHDLMPKIPDHGLTWAATVAEFTRSEIRMRELARGLLDDRHRAEAVLRKLANGEELP